MASPRKDLRDYQKKIQLRKEDTVKPLSDISIADHLHQLIQETPVFQEHSESKNLIEKFFSRKNLLQKKNVLSEMEKELSVHLLKDSEGKLPHAIELKFALYGLFYVSCFDHAESVVVLNEILEFVLIPDVQRIVRFSRAFVCIREFKEDARYYLKLAKEDVKILLDHQAWEKNAKSLLNRFAQELKQRDTHLLLQEQSFAKERDQAISKERSAFLLRKLELIEKYVHRGNYMLAARELMGLVIADRMQLKAEHCFRFVTLHIKSSIYLFCNPDETDYEIKKENVMELYGLYMCRLKHDAPLFWRGLLDWVSADFLRAGEWKKAKTILEIIEEGYVSSKKIVRCFAVESTVLLLKADIQKASIQNRPVSRFIDLLPEIKQCMPTADYVSANTALLAEFQEFGLMSWQSIEILNGFSLCEKEMQYHIILQRTRSFLNAFNTQSTQDQSGIYDILFCVYILSLFALRDVDTLFNALDEGSDCCTNQNMKYLFLILRAGCFVHRNEMEKAQICYQAALVIFRKNEEIVKCYQKMWAHPFFASLHDVTPLKPNIDFRLRLFDPMTELKLVASSINEKRYLKAFYFLKSISDRVYCMSEKGLKHYYVYLSKLYLIFFHDERLLKKLQLTPDQALLHAQSAIRNLISIGNKIYKNWLDLWRVLVSSEDEALLSIKCLKTIQELFFVDQDGKNYSVVADAMLKRYLTCCTLLHTENMKKEAEIRKKRHEELLFFSQKIRELRLRKPIELGELELDQNTETLPSDLLLDSDSDDEHSKPSSIESEKNEMHRERKPKKHLQDRLAFRKKRAEEFGLHERGRIKQDEEETDDVEETERDYKKPIVRAEERKQYEPLRDKCRLEKYRIREARQFFRTHQIVMSKLYTVQQALLRAFKVDLIFTGTFVKRLGIMFCHLDPLEHRAWPFSDVDVYCKVQDIVDCLDAMELLKEFGFKLLYEFSSEEHFMTTFEEKKFIKMDCFVDGMKIDLTIGGSDYVVSDYIPLTDGKMMIKNVHSYKPGECVPFHRIQGTENVLVFLPNEPFFQACETFSFAALLPSTNQRAYCFRIAKTIHQAPKKIDIRNMEAVKAAIKIQFPGNDLLYDEIRYFMKNKALLWRESTVFLNLLCEAGLSEHSNLIKNNDAKEMMDCLLKIVGALQPYFHPKGKLFQEQLKMLFSRFAMTYGVLPIGDEFTESMRAMFVTICSYEQEIELISSAPVSTAGYFGGGVTTMVSSEQAQVVKSEMKQ